MNGLRIMNSKLPVLRNNYSHILVTMLNVRTKPKYKWPPTDEWVNRRLNLFDKYTYPSINNQLCKNFTWIMVASKTNISKNTIKRINGYENIKVLWIDGEEWFDKKHLIEYCNQLNLLKNRKWLISTTIDSDDILHNSYTELIQNKYFPNVTEDLKIINFSLGYRVYMKEKLVKRKIWNHNSLFTMIEVIPKDIMNLNTCRMVYSHVQICSVTFPKQSQNIKTSSPMWLQLIHDSNVKTSYEDNSQYIEVDDLPLILKTTTLKKNFGIDKLF